MNYKQLIILIFTFTLVTFVFFFGRSHHITDYNPGESYMVSGGIGIKEKVYSHGSPYPIYSRRLDDKAIATFSIIALTTGLFLYVASRDRIKK